MDYCQIQFLCHIQQFSIRLNMKLPEASDPQLLDLSQQLPDSTSLGFGVMFAEGIDRIPKHSSAT
jgi:hypothetical protein